VSNVYLGKLLVHRFGEERALKFFSLGKALES
jgi:hypothetical protein